MIRLIIFFLYMAGYLIYSIPTLRKLKRLDQNIKVSERDKIIHEIPKRWSRVIMKITGAKIIIQGQENIPDGPVVIISNHEGDFDIPVLLGHIDKPFGFISKIEVKKVPVLSSWMEVMGCVFLDRKNRRQAIQSIKDGVELLKRGHSLVIFPEGTRSKGGPIGEFKSGSFRLAVDANVPIVPISISGTADLFEKNQRLVKPALVKVVIGEPIYSHINTNKDIKELAYEVKDTIVKQLDITKSAS